MTGVREAALVLADGTTFEGEAIGAEPPGGVATGEVVFNTVLTGYQEVITDPSYAGQIIAFTYPHIGNYGATADDRESAPTVLPRRDRARSRAPPEQLAQRRGSRHVPAGDRRRRDRRDRHPPADPSHPRRGSNAGRVRHRRRGRAEGCGDQRNPARAVSISWPR